MTAITTRAENEASTSSDGPLHKPEGQDVAAAKAKFIDAAKNGISELIRQHGYSRERATALLLKELRRGDISPGDNEIFRLMGGHGIGMEDASSALIISRAVKRVKAERGLSVADAIDDLTSRLNVSTLLELRDNESSGDVAPDAPTAKKAVDHVTVDVAPQRAPQRKLARKVSKSLKGKKALKNHPASDKSTANAKQSGRKRSIPMNEEKNKGLDMDATARRVRADSVSEAEIAKKAKMSSPEESSNVEASRGKVMSPAQVVVRKRGHRGDEPQGTPTPMKRARTEL